MTNDKLMQTAKLIESELIALAPPAIAERYAVVFDELGCGGALLLTMAQDYVDGKMNTKGLAAFAKLSRDLRESLPELMAGLSSDLQGTVFLRAVEVGEAAFQNRFDLAEWICGRGMVGHA